MITTSQSKAIQAMLEPVYAVATHVYNAAAVGRIVIAATVEGLVKQGDLAGRPNTRPGLHETVQSALGKSRVTLEIVQEARYNTADFAGVTGV
jgi:hypothetical protein